MSGGPNGAAAPGAVAVVHLVWKPLGPEVLAAFLAAYHRHPAGIAHRLMVVYNGFASDDDRAPYERLLADTAHDALVLSGPVQDLPAYHAAARAIATEYVCFLNSYSAPLAPGWLAALHRYAAQPGVGLVGASGSWESHYTNAARLVVPHRAAALWLLSRLRPSNERFTVDHYRRVCHGLSEAARTYDPFPSPHLRTNAFMLRRGLMLSLRWPPIRTKEEAHAFESGREGLTRQVQDRGLTVLVVGRDGRAFEPPDWAQSGTFRSGAQDNLLVADNRTRAYEFHKKGTRKRVARATWGRAGGARSLRRPAAGS